MLISIFIIVAGWFRQRLVALGIFVFAMAVHMIFIEPGLQEGLPQQDIRASLIYSVLILAVLSLIFYGIGAGLRAGFVALRARFGSKVE
jgi:hypothetical protein